MKLRPLSAAVIAAGTLISAQSNAALIIWNGAAGNNDWSDGTNWIGGIAPIATDDAEINANNTVNLSGLTNPAIQSQQLIVGRDASDGQLLSDGTDITADTLSIGENLNTAGDINASMQVINADVTATNGITLAKHTATGGAADVSIELVNGTLTTTTIESLDITPAEGTITDISLAVSLRDMTINTTGTETPLGGQITPDSSAGNTTIEVDTEVRITDSQWIAYDTLDLEIASDVRTFNTGDNNTMDVTALLEITGSTMEVEWFELAEYTGPRDGANNKITNKVTANITDSNLKVKRYFRAGDISAQNHSSNSGISEETVTVTNSQIEIGGGLELTDSSVDNGAYAEDTARMEVIDSTINIERYIELSSDVYLQDAANSTLVSRAELILRNSDLTLGEEIEIADDNDPLVNPASSVTGILEAIDSTVAAEAVSMSDIGGTGRLVLDGSMLTLTDVPDALVPGDAGTLENNEASLTMGARSTLKFVADGAERSTAATAKGGNGLYGAIDALQVTLDGKLEVELTSAFAKTVTLDLIRVERNGSLVLGAGAFNGIQGSFDAVSATVNGVSAKISHSVVTENIGGIDYDILRVVVRVPNFILENQTFVHIGNLPAMGLMVLGLLALRRRR